MQSGARTTPGLAFGPTRTLTFMFADLRDYTRFVEARGDHAASELIAEYRRLVRGAIARSGGAEVKTEGDSFYVVFEAARAAIECAVAILQEADLRTRERADMPIRVGVGIHAGEPVPQEGQYVGSAVNLAARLGAAAGPGEILVSDVVRGLLRTSGLRMADRGPVALKGIDEPMRAFVVEWTPLPPRAAPSGPPGEVAVPAGAPLDRRVLSPVVVGRDEELARLDAILARVRGGHPASVLIGGEAGVGKSAFLRSFAERARRVGAGYHVGESVEVDARRPFGPFVDALRSAVADAQDHLAERLPAELAALLSPWQASGPGEDLSESERYRIHASILHALTEIGRRAPIVIALEDVHWADSATLELVPYLARKLRDTSVLLLGTYRTDELHRRHPLRPVLADLERARAVERIQLRPLHEDEVGDLIRAALKLDRAPTPEFRALIHERCEGNPLFVEEVLRALVERGELEYRDGSWHRTKAVDALVIPDSIRDAVLERTSELGEDERQILQHAAVIGQRFDLDLLQRVAKADDALAIGTMRAAIEAQVVEPDRSASRESYRFRHALTREAILSELLQRERQLMHRAVGEAIEASPDAPQGAEDLAYHFDEAGDGERARRYRSDAARDAMRLYAFARAAEHLERAIALTPRDDAELAELHLRLAEAAYFVPDFARAERAAREAKRIFVAIGDRPRAAAAIWRVASVIQMRGDFDELRVLTREAVALLEPLGPSAGLALAYGRLGRIDMIENEPAPAIEWSERALRIAREVGDAEAEGYALMTLGGAKSRLGDPDASPIMRQALEIALRSGNVEHAMVAYTNLIVSSFQAGAWAEAREVFAEIRELCTRVGRWSPPLQQWRTWYAIVDGEWDAALAFERGNLDNESTFAAARITWLQIVTIARDGPEAAIPVVDEMRRRELAARNEQSRRGATFSAVLRWMAGDLRGAIADVEAAADVLLEDAPAPPVAAGAIAALMAARTLGDTATLDRLIELAAVRRSALRGPLEARRTFARALRAERDGDVDAALRELDAMPPLMTDFAPTVWVATSQLRIDLLLRAGERDEAQAEAARMLAYWKKAGARWYLERLSEWARERGLAPE